MRNMLGCVIVALMSVICLAQSPAAPDYGFEKVAETGMHLNLWRANTSQPLDSVEVAEGTQHVRSGKYAAKIVHASAERPGHLYSEIAQPIQAGEKYTVSFWVKGKGEARAMAYLYRVNGAGEESFDSSVGLPGLEGVSGDAKVPDDGQWHHRQYSLQFANAEVKSARMVIEASGTLYVDDAQFAGANSPAASSSDENPAVRVNLITLASGIASPKVDGVIAENEYTVSGTGLLSNKMQDLYRLPNSFHLSRDKDRLYFAMSLKLPDGYTLAEQSRNRDDRNLVASRDVMYLFVRPDNDVSRKGFNGAYLAVAANGTVYDAWETVDWEQGACERDASFNAEWDVKTQMKDGTWTAEVSVPLKDLKIAAEAKDATALLSFGMNLKDTAVVWQVHPNWFDHYQAFGQLRFSDDGVVAEMPSAGGLSRGQLAPTFRLKNAGKSETDYQLTYLISTPRMVGGGIGGYVFDQIIDKRNKDVVGDESVYQWTPAGTIKPGAGAEQVTKAELPNTGYYVLEMEARAGGQAVAYQKIPFRYYPPIVGELTPVPSKELIKADISLAGAAAEERGMVRVVFKDKQGQIALSQDLPADRDEIAESISMEKLAPGDYDVSFILTTATGSEIAKADTVFKKWETPAWLKERAGIDALEPNWVPPPWTKVRQASDRVSVWGRDFIFKPSSLIADITSQEMSVLASGAVIKYTAGGKEHAITVSDPNFEAVNDGRIELTQTGDSPDFSLKVRQTIEFDGLDRIDLTITPKTKNVSIDKMWLDLPFRNMPFTAFTDLDGRFWQHGIAGDEFFATPRALRWLWIGNDDVGCGFFVDNYKGWIINSKLPRITMRTEAESRTLELRLVNEPSQVAGPMEITFGLQPSPFKEPFANWRDLRPDGMGMSPPPTNLVMPHASIWNSTDSKPSPRSWQMLDDMMAYLHGRGQKVYPYLGAFFISPYDYISREFPFDTSQQSVPAEFVYKTKKEATRQEEYFYFAEDWLGSPHYIVDAPMETRQEARMSPSSSWTDFFVHGIQEMLKRSKLDGVYLDIQQPMTSYSEEKGHVFVTKDGVREGTAELFATRDFYKRMYRVFEQNRATDQRPWMLGHSFACNVPFSSFWDINFNGEEIKPEAKFQATALNVQNNVTGHPMAVITDPTTPLDYSGAGYRAVFGGQFGVPTMYLPQYGYVPELKIPEHSREMLSITFLHNNLIWPAYISPEPVYEFWSKVEIPFGMGDAEFFPYWNNDVKTSPAYIKASYWKKPNGDLLLAVANWSGDTSSAEIELPAGFVAKATATDMETGETISLQKKLMIPVGAHNLRVFRTGQPAAN